MSDHAKNVAFLTLRVIKVVLCSNIKGLLYLSGDESSDRLDVSWSTQPHKTTKF